MYYNPIMKTLGYNSLLDFPTIFCQVASSKLIEHLTSNDLIKFFKRIILHSSITDPFKPSTTDILALWSFWRGRELNRFTLHAD